LHSCNSGAIIEKIVVKVATRFTGTGCGLSKLELLDENNNVISAKAIRIGNLVHSTLSYFEIEPNFESTSLHPKRIYARIGSEEAQESGTTTTYERSLITTTAGTSLSAKYFTLHTDTYIWFNTGASSDPAPGGFTTGIEVAISASSTAAAVAEALYRAMLATDGFITSWDGSNKVLICDDSQANKTDVAAGNSGFTVTKEVNGGATPGTLANLSQGSVDVFVKFTKLF